MSRIIESYILCFIENILCNTLFSSFFVPRKKNVFFNTMIIAFYNIFLVVLTLSGIQNNYLKICMNVLLFSITFYTIYKSGFINIIAASIAYVAITLCTETPFYIFIPYILGQKRLNIISNNYFLLTIIGLLVKLCVLIVILVICRLFGQKGYLRFLNTKDWLSYLCLPLFSMLILISLVYYDISFFSAVIALTLLLFNVLFYSYLQENGAHNKKKHELIALEDHSKNQLKAFNDISRLYEEQRRQIHEFKNQINYINGLVDKEDYATLKKYTGKIKSDMDSETYAIETGNPVINVLINQVVNKALYKNISIMPDIKINTEIAIEDNDIIIIISNLLNNAIEHCETLTYSNRIITFKLENTPDHLLIICTNPIESQIIVEDNLIRTTKKDAAEHGYGLKNILLTVNKYKGTVSITTDENKFKYIIMINYAGN